MRIRGMQRYGNMQPIEIGPKIKPELLFKYAKNVSGKVAKKVK